MKYIIEIESLTGKAPRYANQFGYNRSKKNAERFDTREEAEKDARRTHWVGVKSWKVIEVTK